MYPSFPLIPIFSGVEMQYPKIYFYIFSGLRICYIHLVGLGGCGGGSGGWVAGDTCSERHRESLVIIPPLRVVKIQERDWNWLSIIGNGTIHKIE